MRTSDNFKAANFSHAFVPHGFVFLSNYTELAKKVSPLLLL